MASGHENAHAFCDALMAKSALNKDEIEVLLIHAANNNNSYYLNKFFKLFLETEKGNYFC